MKKYLGCLLGIMVAALLTSCAASNQSRKMPQLVIVSPNDSSATATAIKDSLFNEWAKNQVTPQKLERPKYAHQHHGHWGQTIGSIFTVRATPNGVETEYHSPVERISNNWQTRPKLFQQYPPNLGSGWQEVTYEQTLYIPWGVSQIALRLQPYGHPVEVWYLYDGNKYPIYGPDWYFCLPNSGAVSDDYHLWTYARYTTGEIDSTHYRVQNQAVR